MTDNLTEYSERPGSMTWDPKRFDREEWNDHCKVCNNEIKSGGGRGGAVGWCPECGVTVWLL